MWTIGHSTRTIEVFLHVLAAHGIEAVADVRRFPGSRRQPQYGEEMLRATLSGAGLTYPPLPALGGRRRPAPDSANTGWRHPAFRGYADHMASEEFADGLYELLMLSQGARTAIMCAELLWWRCHRRLIADVLTTLHYAVFHIFDAETAHLHRLQAPARLVDGVLRYTPSDNPIE